MAHRHSSRYGNYMLENNAVALLKASGRRIFVHCVVTGGQALAGTSSAPSSSRRDGKSAATLSRERLAAGHHAMYEYSAGRKAFSSATALFSSM